MSVQRPAPSAPRHARLALALGLAALTAGCAATDPSERLAELYDQSQEEATGESQPAVADVEARQKQARRLARNVESRAREARRFAESGLLERPHDMLVAAQLLYESRTLENVSLARELALHAVELGDARGLPIAAEAEDVELMIRGLPQRYGTQYVFDPVSERWTLYPVNSDTSDTERAAMGIVSLEEARARELILNERRPTLPRREQSQ